MKKSEPNNAMDVRVFKRRDAEEVKALWSRAFADDPPWNAPEEIIRHKLAVQPGLFLVGVLRSKVVAAVMAGYDGNRGWIYHLAVAPELQRNSLGRQMMGEAEARLRALGCPKINLQVRSSNSGVVKFYDRLGYSVEDRISMGKRLD